MSTIEQQARIELSLNAQKAVDKLKELKKQSEELNQKLNQTEKGTKQYQKLEKQLNAVEKNIKKVQQAAFDVNKVLDNLSGASINDINKAIKEMNRQMNAMDRNSDKWRFYKQQIERAKEELRSINAEGKKTESWLSRMNSKFNQWGAGIATFIAGITGVTLTIQKFRQMAVEKESAQANLKALTGLDDQAIAWLTRQAEQLSTSMESSGLRVRQSAQEILDAYTLVGSAKPELLTDKEALNAVTIEAMRLAEAARMDLKEAVDAVTLSMNQYGATAEEVSRYTNVMAAGSKYGSAAVQSITVAVKNSGLAAAAANIPIEQLVGSIETLAEKGIKDEVAGTGLKTFFLKLEGMADDVRPSVVGLQTSLENLKAKGMDAVEMQKAFGLEAYTVAQAMISGADKVKYYTEAVTGTNVAVEQAIINSDTAEAKRAQTINKIKEVGIEIGQRLTPVLVASAKASTVAMEGFLALLEACEKYKTTIIALVSAITYMTVVKNKDIIVTKLSVLWNQKLLGSVKALWTVLRANPITAVISAATILLGIFADFIKKTIETNKEIKALNNTVQTITKESNRNIAEEKARLNDLLKIARDEMRSKKERVAALEEIKKMSPEYLKNLTLEKINSTEAAEAINKYVNNLRALEKLRQATTRRSELRDSLQQELDKYYQSNEGLAKAQRFGKISFEEFTDLSNTSDKSSRAKRAVYNDLFRENKLLQATIKAYNDVNKIIEKQNSIILKNQVVSAQSNLNKPVVSASVPALDNKDSSVDYNDILKERVKSIEDAANAQKVVEQISYLQGEKSLEEHLKAMNRIEDSAITAKQMLYLDDMDKWNELQLERLQNTKSYEEKMLAIKQRYQDEVAQFRAKYEEKTNEERMNEELAVLDKFYQDNMVKEEEYQELKASIIKKFTEETDRHRRRVEEDFKEWDELNTEEKLERIAKYAEEAWSQISALMNAGSELMQANMDLEIAKINQRYDTQLERAEGNEAETKKIESRKEAEIARVKNEYNKRAMKMQMAQLLATSAMGMLNAWVSAMKIEPAFLIPVYGGIFSGIIAAQTAIQVAALKKQHEAQAAGYYSGGYTSRTAKDTDEAGVVHGNEFVVNARGVRNPAVRPVLDFIDRAQRNNYISSITPADVAMATGIVKNNTTIINNTADRELMTQFVSIATKLSRQLDKPIVAQTYITGKGGSEDAQKMYNKMITNAER